MLELFRNQAGPEESHDDLLDLFVGDWDRFAKRVSTTLTPLLQLRDPEANRFEG